MPTMGVVTVDQHSFFLAQLRPAGPAVIADGAALVVVHHYALADLRLLVADPGTDRGDDAARLVPGDDRFGGGGKPAGIAARFRPPVLVQVAAAHPGRLHFD